MRAIRYHEYGSPDVLRSEEIGRPSPKRGEVLVAVRAAGINPVDAKFRDGSYPQGSLPKIPGSDFAGVVDAVGDDVDEFAVGDRVFGTGLGIDRQGTCAEYGVATTTHLATLPDGIAFTVGAGIGLVGVTAWEGLIETAELAVGDRCLVHGGSGGVGHVAVQLASAAGASVVATAAEQYHDRVRALGADTVLSYDRPDLASAIGDAGAPDVVLDHRIDQHIELNTEIASQGARIVAIDSTAPELRYPDSGLARAKMHTLYHFAMISLSDYSSTLGLIARLLESGTITAEVARTYDLADTDQAHRDVAETSFLGKAVVVP
ncbi:alcohol dehydrogenase catalytic domain-containing protein [Natrinema longum]|uniref:alcohol dehydrogenase catalytic domain-containing protein n=1 Tax=Natrinema longum TaxID=370324 RepID=UPI001CCB23B8|nr:zinc-binding dehydrogenase [Natrinema longum]MBZ6496790.1 zinc-binding dehydrogenase [Natrinema longum]